MACLFTCARKGAASAWRRKFTPTNCRRRGSIPWRPMRGSGFASDLRDYGLGAQILFDLGVRKFRFLTNNPKKVVGLEGYGIQMVEQVPIRSEANPHNAQYLETKRTQNGAHCCKRRALSKCRNSTVPPAPHPGASAISRSSRVCFNALYVQGPGGPRRRRVAPACASAADISITSARRF